MRRTRPRTRARADALGSTRYGPAGRRALASRSWRTGGPSPRGRAAAGGGRADEHHGAAHASRSRRMRSRATSRERSLRAHTAEEIAKRIVARCPPTRRVRRPLPDRKIRPPWRLCARRRGRGIWSRRRARAQAARAQHNGETLVIERDQRGSRSAAASSMTCTSNAARGRTHPAREAAPKASTPGIARPGSRSAPGCGTPSAPGDHPAPLGVAGYDELLHRGPVNPDPAARRAGSRDAAANRH